MSPDEPAEPSREVYAITVGEGTAEMGPERKVPISIQATSKAGPPPTDLSAKGL